jgi:hypothetical protein
MKQFPFLDEERKDVLNQQCCHSNAKACATHIPGKAHRYTALCVERRVSGAKVLSKRNSGGENRYDSKIESSLEENDLSFSVAPPHQ